jgi:hypothetical protein
MSVFLRNHGLWLLLVPICWTLLTLWADRNPRAARLYRALLLLGLLLVCAAIALFGWAALFPNTRPPLIYIGG